MQHGEYPDGVVRLIELDTADQLIEALNPPLEVSAPHEGHWIYRGVSSSSYELLPSALRPNVDLGKLSGLNNTNPPPERIQRMNEIQVILQFQRQLNRRGLRQPVGVAPVMTASFSAELMGRLSHISGFPEDDLLPLLALAQHYGIPTRLLDWTQDPMTAAYFAASGGLRRLQEHSGDRIAVWSLNASTLGMELRTSPLRIFYPAYADNPNLAAQRGVFTLWRDDGFDVEEAVDRRPLDRLIAGDNALSEWAARDTGEQLIRKITIPSSESPQLLRHLWHRDRDPSILFPGYAGVADAIHELAMVNALRRPSPA